MYQLFGIFFSLIDCSSLFSTALLSWFINNEKLLFKFLLFLRQRILLVLNCLRYTFRIVCMMQIAWFVIRFLWINNCSPSCIAFFISSDWKPLSTKMVTFQNWFRSLRSGSNFRHGEFERYTYELAEESFVVCYGRGATPLSSVWLATGALASADPISFARLTLAYMQGSFHEMGMAVTNTFHYYKAKALKTELWFMQHFMFVMWAGLWMVSELQKRRK